MDSTQPAGALIPREAPPTLDALARAIADAHAELEKMRRLEQTASQWIIDTVYQLGHFLRTAKSRIKHGNFENWIERTQKFGPRMAQKYIRCHKWMLVHQSALINAVPHTRRQLFILAGIVPEDEPKNPPGDKRDELAGIRKIGRRLCVEVAAHRDYAEIEALQKALEEVTRMIKDVHTDTQIQKRTT